MPKTKATEDLEPIQPVSGTADDGPAGAAGDDPVVDSAATQTEAAPATTEADGTNATDTTADTQPVSAKPSLSGLRDYLSTKYGIDTASFADEENLAAQLVTAAQQAHTYRQQLAAYEAQRQQAAQQQPQAQPKAPETPKSILERKPEWQDWWLHEVERDPITNTLKAKAGSPPGIVDKINTFLTWKKERDRAEETDPIGLYAPVLQPWIDKQVEERFKAFQAQQAYDNVLARNEGWLYATVNGDGKTFLRDAKGERIPSAYGERFFSHLHTLKEQGIKDMAQAANLAQRLAFADAALEQQQQKPAEKPAETPKPAAVTPQTVAQRLSQRSPSTNGAGAATKGLSLREMLTSRLASFGDEEFRRPVMVEEPN